MTSAYVRKLLIYAQYFCNKLKTIGKICKLQKKIIQVFIVWLVGELTPQWINPGDQCVHMLIKSSKVLFHLHTQVSLETNNNFTVGDIL